MDETRPQQVSETIHFVWHFKVVTFRIVMNWSVDFLFDPLGQECAEEEKGELLAVMSLYAYDRFVLNARAVTATKTG